MKLGLLDSILSDTMEGMTVDRVEAVYRELDKRQEEFVRKFQIHCIPGCGHCCEGYVPYMSEAEAIQAAYTIFKEGKEEEIRALLEAGTPEEKGCPLYLADREYHCALYEGRSLVCRLFGLSATEDKEKHLVFRSCKWKEVKENLSSALLEENREVVPVMSCFGGLLNECSEGVDDGESIYTALPHALDKLKMILAFASFSQSGKLDV